MFMQEYCVFCKCVRSFIPFRLLSRDEGTYIFILHMCLHFGDQEEDFSTLLSIFGCNSTP